MDNIYTYMDWRGDLSFFQDEWNEVDSMIFAQMVYVRFENLKHVNWNEGITIASVCKELKKSYKIKGARTVFSKYPIAYLIRRSRVGVAKARHNI